ncbi:MAG: hypothetical protein HUU55_00140 [Myxococcales bacterium]|nr:hypothetical protein [Myxococcales bacterium]
MQRLPYLAFETQTGTVFAGRTVNDTQISLRLVRTHDLGCRPSLNGNIPCYWLLFESEDHTDHRAGPHVLRHHALGELLLELVPVGHSSGRMLLQALFD